MISLKFVCYFGLLWQSVWSATVPPPPSIQTLDASNTGPEYKPVINSPTDQKTATKSDPVEDAEYWKKVGMKQLQKTIEYAQKLEDTGYKKKAKNIIVFVGDGMGLTTITAGRIYKGQYLKQGKGEETTLAFDEFPNTGLAKTYNVDKQVPDSAGTATAMFSGIKTDYGAIGMDITRSRTNATQGRLQSIMDWAQGEGKRTGIVTTTRITHATPAATYAHIYHRDWECDTSVPADAKGKHVDIARQLIENAPGNKFNVILGGGLSVMGALNKNETRSTNFEGSTESVCKRGDERNLIDEWLQLGDKTDSRVFVQSRKDLLGVDVNKVDHLMGLFRNNHITYSIAREEGEPSLKEMTQTAIGVLERGADSKGYVLLVEGGRIDQGHHQNYARVALHEVYEFDMAIEAALNMTNPKETLVLVTADHSHAVTLNGYPGRGSDILGFASKSSDPMTYETISYANGPGYWDHMNNNSMAVGSNSNNTFWIPLEQISEQERAEPTYRHMATVANNEESHGGEDVIVFAHGPGASLVRGVFEQNYLAYIMSYAGCMGPAKDVDNSCQPTRTSGALTHRASVLVLVLAVVMIICLNLIRH